MKIKDMLGISNARLIFGDVNTEIDFNYFSKDTRTIEPNAVFLGIKGDHFDGNDYWEEAFKKGASTCILSKEVDNKFDYPNQNLVIVDDMQEFLIKLATPIREKLNIPIIAVTGSVGKTSTKNIIADILSVKYKVLKTNGNLNTPIGLALTILRIKDEEIAVVEMGMNHAGEISLLTNFAKPDVAVITNIGTAHIGNLGSRENILKAKLEILEGLQGPLVINHDTDLPFDWHQNNTIANQVISYGIDTPSDYQATDLNYDNNGSHFKIDKEQVDINVIGKHFIYNSLVAFVIGDLYGVEHEKMIQKLKNISLEPNRMELIKNNDITIINDTYNASYDSIYYALEVLSEFSGRKIAVLGDILELGEYSEEIHRKIGSLIIKNKIDILITVGKYSKLINDEAIHLGLSNKVSYHLDKNEDVIKLINEIKRPNDNYLIKASNSMKFIEIVNGIKD